MFAPSSVARRASFAAASTFHSVRSPGLPARRSALLALLSVAVVAAPQAAQAQQPVDTAALKLIRTEGTQRSQVMELASWLTDVYGPRLTNSPQTRAAGEWTVKTLKEWGVGNAHLEWYPFGRGWVNERAVAQVVGAMPYTVPIYPGAWTVGTNGPKTGDVVIVSLANNATEADAAPYRGKLRGKIVLASPLPTVNPLFDAPGRRWTPTELDSLRGLPLPAAGGGGFGNRPAPPANLLDRNRFWVDEGVLAVIVPGNSRGNSGSVSNAPTGNRAPDAPPSVPQLAVMSEHYGRMFRTVEKGQPVKMELDVRNRFTSDDLNSFNVVAELPGTDKKDEIVMLGAHFDSWHNATGATDNAGSSAVMLEAMRILKATGLPLRRTVRIGLWTGEEQGLLGSRAFVTEHFGTADQPKTNNSKVSVYFNQDNGGGAIRGIWGQSNLAAVPIFDSWFRAVDVNPATSARAITLANTGSTDHIAFDAVGIPGFQFLQDPMEYSTRTHHSSQDFYERLVPADMMHNAVIVASFVYLAANRDEPFPRK